MPTNKRKTFLNLVTTEPVDMFDTPEPSQQQEPEEPAKRSRYLARKKVVADSLTKEAGKTTRDRIIAILDKSAGKEAHIGRLQTEANVTRDYLKNVITREVSRDYPAFRRSRRGFIKLTSGLAPAQVIDWDTVECPVVSRRFALPGPLRGLFGSAEGITENAFILVAAEPDSYKTAFLIDNAATSAKAGARVLLINHETDNRRMFRLLAQREEGRILSAEDALEVCRSTDWIRRITVRTASTQQIEELRLKNVDVLVWDYLSASFLRSDSLISQGSQYSNYVQLLGQRIVDKGVPLITAVQKHWGENGVKSTWFERATIGLLGVEVERGVDNDIVTYKVVKNKEGGIHDFLDVYYDNRLGVIESARAVTSDEWKARIEAKRKKSKQQQPTNTKQRKGMKVDDDDDF